MSVSYPSLAKKIVHIPGACDTKDLVMLLVSRCRSLLGGSVFSMRTRLAALLSKSFSISPAVLLPLVSSWQSCSNGSFRGNRGTFERHLRTAPATSRQKRRLI